MFKIPKTLNHRYQWISSCFHSSPYQITSIYIISTSIGAKFLRTKTSIWFCLKMGYQIITNSNGWSSFSSSTSSICGVCPHSNYMKVSWNRGTPSHHPLETIHFGAPPFIEPRRWTSTWTVGRSVCVPASFPKSKQESRVTAAPASSYSISVSWSWNNPKAPIWSNIPR